MSLSLELKLKLVSRDRKELISTGGEPPILLSHNPSPSWSLREHSKRSHCLKRLLSCLILSFRVHPLTRPTKPCRDWPKPTFQVQVLSSTLWILHLSFFFVPCFCLCLCLCTCCSLCPEHRSTHLYHPFA